MWQFIAAVAVTLIATFALRPKPQNTPPATLNEFRLPTAEDGREVPVVFGCRWVRSPNVLWYGDLRTTAIKSRGGKK